MPSCNCSGQTCGCVITAGEGVTIAGAGGAKSPYVISVEGGGAGGGGWESGDLKEVAHGNTPAGWLECLGQAVSRIAYPALFTAIGITYGVGDGSTTFNLPNYTGKSRVGAGAGFTLGAGGGVADTTLATANLPAHTHLVFAHNHDLGAHIHSDAHDHGLTGGQTANHQHVVKYDIADNTETKASGGARRVVKIGSGSETAATGNDNATHQHVIPAWNGLTGGPSTNSTSTQPTVASGSTGSGVPFTNLPPYRVVRVLIHT